MANDNVELGRFDLVGIPSAPRGIPQIEVTFDIDANGIIHVHAKDLGTQKEQSIKIMASSKLSDAEIEQMVKNAEKFAEEDKKRKEGIEIRNNADNLLYQTEKSVKEHGDKVSAEEKTAIETAMNDLKELLKGEDFEAIKEKTETLQTASYKLAEAIYKDAQAKQSQSQGSADGANSGTENNSDNANEKKDDETVVDADFDEKK
jgi:molecular chaperone DnaK